jgi:hypothetical protein
MIRKKTAFQVALILGFGNALVSAGVIQHSHEAPTDRINPPPLIANLERTSSEFDPLPLAPDLVKETAGWAKLVKAPLISADLASPTLLENLSQSSTPERPRLPVDPLLGAGSENMLTTGVAAINPEIASNDEFGHNIRIPEPASLALVAAGIVGIVARRRLRKNLQSKKNESLGS